MTSIQKNKFISKINFKNILILYIILQPIIDIITSICIRNVSEKLSLGIFIRVIFMLYLMIYTIIKVDKKSKIEILIYYACIAIYGLFYIVNCYIKTNLTMIFTQIKGFVKVFYLPIVLASMLEIYKKEKYTSKQKYLNISLIIYVLTITICKIFSIGYPTYPLGDNFGTIGLFYAGNEISAIVAFLAPICFSVLFTQKLNFLNVIASVLTVYAMLEIGTKVSFVSIVGLIIIALVLAFIKILKDKNFYKQFITLISITLLTILFVGNTSIGKNLNIQPFLQNSQKHHTDSNNTIDSTQPQDNPQYNPQVLLSSRDIYFTDSLNSYKKSSFVDKLVGSGYLTYNENNVIQENKLIEIDYFDIFFCHGILGTIIYIIPLAIIIIIAIKKFFINFKVNIQNNNLILMLYSIALGFGIALIAGHVLTAPAVSIFLVLIMLEMLTILNNKEVC